MGLFFNKKKKQEEVIVEPTQQQYIYEEDCEAYVTDHKFLIILTEVCEPFCAEIGPSEDHFQIDLMNVNFKRAIEFGDITMSFRTAEEAIYKFELLPEEARRQQMEKNKRVMDREHPFIKGTYDISNKLK